jgi:hypothetical protein
LKNPSFDILVNLIPHRLEKFTELLDCLEPQMAPGVRVLVAYDNLEYPWTAKCNALIAASNADYVAHIDDDDLVSPDYVSSILKALESEPDYVGFKVRYTLDGVQQMPVIHSLSRTGWVDTPDALYRDICDKNPIRRSRAMLVEWRGGNGADRTWANDLRSLDIIKREIFIDAELYYYRNVTADTYTTGRQPFDVLPEPPQRSFVEYLRLDEWIPKPR